MNFRNTIEFAGAVSAHAQHLLTCDAAVSTTALGYYWKLQRSWLNRMRLQFHDLSEGLLVLPGDRELLSAMTSLMHEMTCGELVQRTWATVLTVKDQVTGRPEHGPIVRNLHVPLLELRRSYLAMLLDERLPSETFLFPVDRQRRRAEAWTNFICGHLVAEYDASEFVHQASEARTYHLEHLYYLLSREIPRHDEHHDFTLSALEYLLASDLCLDQSRPIGLPEVCGSILNCFPHTAFNDHGLFRPIRTSPEKHRRILNLAVRH